MGEEFTTWDEFREMLAGAYGLAASEYDAVADNLMCGGERKQALYDLSAALRAARDSLKQLTALAFNLAAPGRPLEAVFADIVAEGHTVQLSIHADGNAFLSTHAKDDGADWSLAHGKEPVTLAEERLADIRKLHAEKPDPDHHILAGVGMVHIESGQTGQYAVGELAREGDANPWKVVSQGEPPVLIDDGYSTREAAEAVRDEMNGHSLYAPVCPDSEHEDNMRQDRDAAAEDIRREALASEEMV